jgi:hypothetical protein
MNVTVNIIFLSIKCCSFLFLEYHSRILRTYWATEHSVFLSESTFETFTSDTSMLSSIHMYVKHMFFFYLSLISKLFVNIDASDFDCYKMLYWSCDIVWGSIALLAAQNLLSQQILERFTYLHCKAITTKNYENLGLIWCVHYHSGYLSVSLSSGFSCRMRRWPTSMGNPSKVFAGGIPCWTAVALQCNVWYWWVTLV